MLKRWRMTKGERMNEKQEMERRNKYGDWSCFVDLLQKLWVEN